MPNGENGADENDGAEDLQQGHFWALALTLWSGFFGIDHVELAPCSSGR